MHAALILKRHWVIPIKPDGVWLLKHSKSYSVSNKFSSFVSSNVTDKATQRFKMSGHWCMSKQTEFRSFGAFVCSISRLHDKTVSLDEDL